MTAEHLPRHIAFIMDGNGRWAKQRGVPRVEGHRAGSKAMERIIRYAGRMGVEYLTFYAFSTENWKRSPDEVAALMRLLAEYLADLPRHMGNERLQVLGDLSALKDDLRRKIEEATEKTKHNTGVTVNIAFNYGSRAELTLAAQTLASRCVAGSLHPDDIDEAALAGALYTGDMPDPDLIIRPSGEKRLSNFLLWQAAYAEFIFMDVLWPDFDSHCLDRALEEYRQRDRRFGGR